MLQQYVASYVAISLTGSPSSPKNQEKLSVVIGLWALFADFGYNDYLVLCFSVSIESHNESFQLLATT